MLDEVGVASLFGFEGAVCTVARAMDLVDGRCVEGAARFRGTNRKAGDQLDATR